MDKLGEKAVSNPDYRASPLGNDHAGMTAERWIEKGCKELSLDRETELKTPKRSDLRRAAIAWAIREQSSVSQEWIAEKLGMKSRQNVSQQIRRFEKLPERDLSRELRRWRQKLTIID